MNTSLHSVTLLILVTLGLGLSAGCDTIFGGEDSADHATFNVLLTDAPFPLDLVEEVNVTITEVQLVPGAGHKGQGIITLQNEWDVEGRTRESISYNLLELRDGVTAPLISSERILAGPYSQMRLLIEPTASVVDTSGTIHNLYVPSETETSIHIQLDDLELTGGAERTVTLDFNVEDSFQSSSSVHEPSDVQEMSFEPVVHLQTIREGPPEALED